MMPRRSKVEMLPPRARAKVRRAISQRGFCGYEELARSFKAKGFDVSEDSLQRYGAKLRRHHELMGLADHHAESLGTAHEPAAMLDKAVTLVHLRLLPALLGDEELAPREVVASHL
jgi:hypothetical protein